MTADEMQSFDLSQGGMDLRSLSVTDCAQSIQSQACETESPASLTSQRLRGLIRNDELQDPNLEEQHQSPDSASLDHMASVPKDTHAALYSSLQSSSGKGDTDSMSPLTNASPPESVLGTNIRIAKRGERNSKQHLGKRSAKDADLSDPGSGSDKEVDSKERVTSNENSSKDTNSTTILQSGLAMRSADTRRRKAYLYGRIPHKIATTSSRRSLIPKRTSRLQKTSPEATASTSSLDVPSEAVAEKLGRLYRNLPLPIRKAVSTSSSFDGDKDGESNPVSASEMPSPDVVPSTPIGMFDSPQGSVAVQQIAEQSFRAAEDHAIIGGLDGSADREETPSDLYSSSDDVSLAPSPTPSSQLIMPWNSTSGLRRRQGEWNQKSQNGSLLDDTKHCGATANDPEIVISDGLLLFRSPRNAKPAKYRIAVTASIALSVKRSKGWQDLIVPGLPKVSPDEGGFFLFQIPEDMGMEFRTTNLHRYKMVEDCFCAEFINPGDLVVPLRICDPMYYGVVKNFTVDQEIRADHAITQNGRDGNATSISVRYHAVCSLQIHNLCFWSAKCSFFIYVDGGPQGSFTSQLEPTKEGLKVIYLDTDRDHPPGVSRIQVFCSPSDLERFGVSWQVNLGGEMSSIWLPRIYPALSSFFDRKGDYLRHVLESNETKEFSASEDELEDDRSEDDDAAEDEHEEDENKEAANDDNNSTQSDKSSEFVLHPEDNLRFTILALTLVLLQLPFYIMFSIFISVPFQAVKICKDSMYNFWRKRIIVRSLFVMYLAIFSMLGGFYFGMRIGDRLSTSPWFQRESLNVVSFLRPNRLKGFRTEKTSVSREGILEYPCRCAQSSHGGDGGNRPTGVYPGEQSCEGTAALDSDKQEDARYWPYRMDPHTGDNEDILVRSEIGLRDQSNSVVQSRFVDSPGPRYGIDRDVSMRAGRSSGPTAHQHPQSTSFRDRLDYLLGWRGPIER